METDLLGAVRALRVTTPGLGVKPMVAKLREEQPSLDAGTKQVREALRTLEAESEATIAAAPPPGSGDTGGPAIDQDTPAPPSPSPPPSDFHPGHAL